MKPAYRAWIEAELREQGISPERRNTKWLRGSCGSYSHAMARAFPELIPAPGFVMLIHPQTKILKPGGEHWWCRTATGAIVDPTVLQFHPFRVAQYLPWPKEEPLPTGKCMDCGSLTYDHETFCSPACEASTLAYLGAAHR